MNSETIPENLPILWDISKQIKFFEEKTKVLLEINDTLTKILKNLIKKYESRYISSTFIEKLSSKLEDGYNTILTKEFSIHLEGEINISIYYWNILIATLWIEKYPNWEVVFNQLQCSKLQNKSWNFYVKGYDWKKVLIELWEILISKLSQNKYIIQPAKLHPSELINSTAFPSWRGYKIYDQTALELGYTYNPETELYEKDI